MSEPIPEELDRSIAERLRAPFRDNEIGKLPRITCRKCSGAQSKVCDEHTKRQCDTCHQYITERHLHLDYVGHAAVTDRLLQIDPHWTWEPVAFDQDGGPLVRVSGNDAVLWIRLTVAGFSRLGVGIVGSGSIERDKQLISDALRNAAMRFGVALDLWSKEDLQYAEDNAEGRNARQQPTAARDSGEARSSPQGPPSDPGPEPERATPSQLDALLFRLLGVMDGEEYPEAWKVASPSQRGAGRIETLQEMVDGERAPLTLVHLAGANALLEQIEQAAREALPCELCGSKRTNRVTVDGVWRCADPKGCTERVEKAAATSTPPGDADEAEAQARETETE